jgi:S1-C subfamily serine protease
MQTPAELTDLANALNGLPILGCASGSPAARAGLCYGDIVLSVDGQPTPSWSAFLQASSARRPWVALRVFRQGRELQLMLTLGGAVATPRAVLEGPAYALRADLSCS